MYRSIKKIRGLKRRRRTLVDYLTGETEKMPNPNESGLGYWHLHIFGAGYIDSKKTPNKVRRDIMQMLINRVEYLISIKRNEQNDYRVYALISLPSLIDSQLVILPYKSCYSGFFERDYEEQKWIPLDKHRNIIKEWNLDVPSNFSIKGFKEIISKDECSYEGELWFIGELD